MNVALSAERGLPGVDFSYTCEEGGMARVGWQEITERFSHIDARFIGCEAGLPHNDGFFTVSLYPWWEHPLLLEAQAAGTRWGFTGTDEGRQ